MPRGKLTDEDLRAPTVLDFKRRMAELDQDHARARSPAARMRIEEKMRELRAELTKFEKAEAALDVAARAWWKETMKQLEDVLGPDPNENDPRLH